MEQYIDKSTVVEEIEKLQKRYSEAQTRNTYEKGLKEGRLIGYKDVLHKLDTLEVKEVDLEKEIYEAEKRFGDIDEMGGYRILMFDDEFRDILRYFFELGLKAQKLEKMLNK